MSKNVQIPIDVFYALCDFFLEGEDVDTKHVAAVLKKKKDAIERHTIYGLSKKKELAPETREYFRQQYLDEKGVKEGFKWQEKK